MHAAQNEARQISSRAQSPPYEPHQNSRIETPRRMDLNRDIPRSFGSRDELRKMNPTYLSYGSPTIGLAGKQALGY